MNSQNLKVSAIICAYTMERLKDIHEAVDSVMAQTLKPYELIVAVDHNEELFQRLKAELPSEVKVVLNEGAQGLSETRNVGIRAATGEITAFIDDDAIAEKDWLEKLTPPFQLPNVVAVGGRAIPLWHNGKRPCWFPEELDWIVGCSYKGLPLVELSEIQSQDSRLATQDSRLRAIRNVPGCNMAFRKEIFEEVRSFRSEMGGIKETPRGGEEAELCLRIKGKIPEALILYVSAAIIHHKVPPQRLSLRYIARRSFNEGFHKSLMEKFSQLTQSTQKAPRTRETLSTENSYLRYLLFTSIPERLGKFYKRGSLSQAGAIIMSIVATGLGYLVEKVRGTSWI